MRSDELKQRLKRFAVEIVLFTRSLPTSEEDRVFSNQILRSASSAAANYRAALLGRSRKEYYAKICITLEEIDESLFWPEMMGELKLVSNVKMQSLITKATELMYILSSTRKTTKSKLHSSQINK